MTRIYQASQLTEHAIVTLDECASHHVARVLRAKVGEPVVLFNGQGGEYAGVITEINKKTVTVTLNEFLDREAESALDIWLAQGISRGEKMDYTIQKAVELGVKQIIPLYTERCNVKLDKDRSEKRLQHWQSIIISACEQSGRNHIPAIQGPQSLESWLPHVVADCCLVLSPYAAHSLKTEPLLVSKPIILLIGPEGGLSDKEIQLAEQHHFRSVNLGPRILRTETAALAAISALQSLFGDMG